MEFKTSDGWTARLSDEGTLDTLIVVTSPKGAETTERFSQEYAGDKRDASGALTEEGFKELAEEAIDAAADLFADCPDCGANLSDDPSGEEVCKACGWVSDPAVFSSAESYSAAVYAAEVPAALSHPRGGMEYPRPTCEGCGKDFQIAERRAAAPLALPVVVSYGAESGADPIGAYLWPDGWLSGGACESPWCLQCADSLGARVEVGEWEEGKACGRCGAAALRDYPPTARRLVTWPFKPIKVPESGAGADEIREAYKLVRSFDALVRRCQGVFLDFARRFEVVEEEVPTVRKIKVLREVA